MLVIGTRVSLATKNFKCENVAHKCIDPNNNHIQSRNQKQRHSDFNLKKCAIVDNMYKQ